MSYKNPPCASDVCGDCPNPDIIATSKVHFGAEAWEFECLHALEIHVTGEGITIDCAKLTVPCCVDNSKDVFVNSPKISPMRSFFETTMKYLGINEKQ